MAAWGREWWDQQIELFGGRCAICGRQPEMLYIDHCHRTKRLRGLLCPGCNSALGRFIEGKWGDLAVDYLTRTAMENRMEMDEEELLTAPPLDLDPYREPPPELYERAINAHGL